MAKREKLKIEPPTEAEKVTATLAVTTAGTTKDFIYEPEKPVKAMFTMALDHTIWVNFCASAEELKTSPSYLLFLLMERYLLTTGKLAGDYRSKNPVAASEPLVVRLEDIQSGPGQFGLGGNYLLKKGDNSGAGDDMKLDLGDLSD